MLHMASIKYFDASMSPAFIRNFVTGRRQFIKSKSTESIFPEKMNV